MTQEASSENRYQHSWEPSVAEQIYEAVKAREDVNNDKNDKNDNDKNDDRSDENGNHRRRPYMVAIVGIPGGGKSVSSFLLLSMLQEDYGLQAMIMPHDGYHIPMGTLKLMPDPQDIIYRRGAPDTFDPLSLERDLNRIKNGTESQVLVPGFDHSKGDPEPDAHVFDRNQHSVVLCEGLVSVFGYVCLVCMRRLHTQPFSLPPPPPPLLTKQKKYLLHNDDGWQNIANYFDFTIYIDSNIDECIERLKVRNLCIPGYTADEIRIRCETVDKTNAFTVLKSQVRADVVVESIVSTSSQKTTQSTTTTSTKTTIATAVQDKDDYKNIENDKNDRSLLPQSRNHLSSEALNLIGIEHFQDNHNNHSYPKAPPPPPNETNHVSTQDDPTTPPASTLIGTWEAEMAQRIRDSLLLLERPEDQPFMVALVGMPGSGKSVSSLLLANHLEEELQIPCMIMPHDGYHIPLEQLYLMPDSENVIYRRGAPDTFDPFSLLRDLKRIATGSEDCVLVPGFDHAKGDPEPDQHVFQRLKHKVVICEGLYLLHDRDGWEEVGPIFDLTIHMNSNLEFCMERVKIRNQCIPGYTKEEIFERVDRVDRANALTVLQGQSRADVVVDSLAMQKD